MRRVFTLMSSRSMAMKTDKYSVIISNIGNRSDHFLAGYGEDRTLSQLFDTAASKEKQNV
jgi:hypothetical protein